MITHDLAWCNDQLQDLLHISLKCFHCLYVSAHVELYCCKIGKLFCTVCSLLFIVANSILSGFFLENPFHNTRVRAKEKVTPDSATLILEVVCQTLCKHISSVELCTSSHKCMKADQRTGLFSSVDQWGLQGRREVKNMQHLF